MATNLAQKLQIKAGNHILLLNAPADFSLPDCTVSRAAGGLFDGVLLFVADSGELAQWWATAVASVPTDGLLWIAYPKISSGVTTDLTRDAGWQLATAAGYRPIRQIAIDDVWSALRFRPSAPAADLIAAQYSGGKAHLRPIFDRLLALARELGPDVTIGPRKTYVALGRGKQFCVIQPSTQTRLDVGLKLPGTAVTPRLVEAGNFASGSITHKVALYSLDDIDDELFAWLKLAYEGVNP
ncbi:MAG: hypothetical protein KC441_15845 [Anaerolineales bacterium]|nr:hypothetical protein [Anaerolineales bacterium]